MIGRWIRALGLLCLAPLAAAQDVHEIRFDPDAHSTVVAGAVVRGSRDVYAFTARRGQTTEISVKAVESNAAISVWRPGARLGSTPDGDIQGTALPGASDRADATRWRGRLPQSGRYLIVVGPTRGNATYELRLSVERFGTH
jgi:hypothetical protein